MSTETFDALYVARFWSKVNVGTIAECWEWTGAGGDSYGRVSTPGGRGTTLAHRIAYRIMVGPIPSGLTIDHLCRNRRCVNPRHLEVVTAGVNTLRGTGPSALNAKKTECLKGHPLSGMNVYVTPQGFRHCRTCKNESRRTGISTGVGTRAAWARLRASGLTGKEVRQWAREHGFAVGNRGTIPLVILDAHEAESGRAA